MVVMTACMLGIEISDRGWWSVPAETLFATFGIVPARLNPLTLITYSLLHGGFGHLLINLAYLWVFGAGVEEAVGSLKFFLLFVAAGIVGGALQWLVTITLLPGAMLEPIVGASAACAGMMGLFAVRYYRARLDFLFMRPHVVVVVSVFLGFEMLAGLVSLVRGAVAGGIAHWAHVGGFVFGLSVAYLLRLHEVGQFAYLTEDAARAMERSVPGEAIRRWETLLAKEPDNAHAMSELARAWLLLGDIDQSTHYFQNAIRTYLAQNRRSEAALTFAEMRDMGSRDSGVPIQHLFTLGIALEEMEQYSLAAETLRGVMVRSPQLPEAEIAHLKVIGYYIHQLNRREEAVILARLFLERYPYSTWRALVTDLMQHAQADALKSAPPEEPRAR